ncbi:cysteine synthase A [Kwoniella mangroviensis CBS 10435]|uniref:cysteine synthase n=1 Tax=Kwoniella mangroviensis CBS 10435 TaxID=1331196 RepID=A0A1B9IR66_9TREE|nr:cysteine synthase A [Kwoniella mangroviensis CBS 8507]OCF58042.1 cysteine synthase A [Kwoniella mangroviensis CBS 10435]OCF68180.1 cysteine synthase A [Kwoniella mangroviensis CBS 8507]OCF74856.1 cysteine synthase A [Kwoniella mangroviensis CBS 8886]
MGLNDYIPHLPLRFWERIRFPNKFTRDLAWGLVIGVTLSLSSTSFALLFQDWRRKRAIARIPPRPIEIRSDEIVNGVIGLIGNTPLIRINSLSDALGVEILGKAEYLNPGGSVKDRVALKIIEDAEAQGVLHPNTGSVLFEGTVGSTGISLATVGKAKGYECCIIMPDDVAIEKVQVLEKLGAKVERVRPASIVDEKQNLARKRALEFGNTPLIDPPKSDPEVVVSTKADSSEVGHEVNSSEPLIPSIRLPELLKPALETKPRGFFADQFENESNFYAHYKGTGPEILRQTSGNLDAFVSGAGTGGTVAGTGMFLKKALPDLKIVLSDPEGSGLYNKVKFNVMFDTKEREGTKRRHQVDTVVEGIGINRITQNFALGLDVIDDAYRISDAEAVAMSRYLVVHDGLYLGSSSACNLVACVRLAKTLGRGSRIATILCDSGSRHQSKFWSDEYLKANDIPIDPSIIGRLLES